MTMHTRGKSTELDIVRVASRMFLEDGYSKTTIRSIAAELEISPGHLMFYFPTKEHLLAVLVDILCGFQWKMMEAEANVVSLQSLKCRLIFHLTR